MILIENQIIFLLLAIFKTKGDCIKKPQKSIFEACIDLLNESLKNETFLELCVFRTDVSNVFGLVRFHYGFDIPGIRVAKVIIIKLGRKQH